MPRFFFHVEGLPDDEGTEVPDLATAKCEAVRYAGRKVCDEAGNFWDTAEFSLIVTDEKGLILFTLSFTGHEAPAISVR